MIAPDNWGKIMLSYYLGLGKVWFGEPSEEPNRLRLNLPSLLNRSNWQCSCCMASVTRKKVDNKPPAQFVHFNYHFDYPS